MIKKLTQIGCLFCLFASIAIAQQAPRPLPDHPGNIFVAGESLSIQLPPGNSSKWTAKDFDGKTIASGDEKAGRADLGALPIGYYAVQRDGEITRTTAAVLAPLKVPTPKTSPIGTDTAAAWFYKSAQQYQDVASLASLAGINWVRDRLAWADMQPTPHGPYVEHNKYDDSVHALHAAGLHVLDVAHQSPPWVDPNPSRFPLDLRDAYTFYRDMAKRWKGEVDAFEPWNEADFGHAGFEMASMQKASYLGLKAGNPDVIVCMNVFAFNRAATLEDVAANDTAPYFDTYNFHHYIWLDQYPAFYAVHRRFSDGKPMWVTEFNTPVEWAGDPKLQEPDEHKLHMQAELVVKDFATALNEGPAELFYFILGHYVEGQTQFGLLHRDLTPRPGYCALAAVGRLLADAKPLGEVKRDPKNLRAYVFHAMPDGTARDVIIAWGDQGPADLHLPAAPLAAYDFLGREVANPTATMHLTTPVFIVMQENASKAMSLTPAPPPPPRVNTPACPIVLQANFPEAQIDPNQSAARLKPDQENAIPLVAYNFSDKPAHVALAADVPTGMTASPLAAIDLAPHQRSEIPMTVSTPAVIAGNAVIRIEADSPEMGKQTLSLNIDQTLAPATRTSH